MRNSSRLWLASQVIGDPSGSEDLLDGDIITAVEFNQDGEFLAIGDKAGRIWLYQQSNDLPSDSDASKSALGSYQYHIQFQSHEPEFDYLKSVEIEERINMIKFCHRESENLFMLSTNNKTVKLWKIHNRKLMSISNLNVDDENTDVKQLRIPTLDHFDTVPAATCKKNFSNAHAYHINSISQNSDRETFLSADDLRINLWNYDVSDQSFNIVDIKPDNMEDLTEVITKASFHPTSCNLLVYSSSRGSLRLIDLRENALADRCSKVFEIEEDPAEKSFFSEIISSISDVQFTPNGNCLVSRDYISLKVWDVRYESKPLEIIPVQDYLRPRLCDLYENDCIFDKFECASSPDGSSFVTGSYNDDFFIYDSKSKSGQTLSACPPLQYGSKSQAENTSRRNSNVQVSVDEMNFSKKSLHTAWHPRADVVAVASLNNLYIYQ